MILGDIYRRNARLWPQGIAYAFGDRRLTNLEFARRVTRLASAMAGVERQDRVAILASNVSQNFMSFGLPFSLIVSYS